MLVENFLNLDSRGLNFGFSELSLKIENFRGYVFFIVGVLELIWIFILALYFYYVIPNDYGVSKHFLFFLGFKKQ